MAIASGTQQFRDLLPQVTSSYEKGGEEEARRMLTEQGVEFEEFMQALNDLNPPTEEQQQQTAQKIKEDDEAISKGISTLPSMLQPYLFAEQQKSIAMREGLKEFNPIDIMGDIVGETGKNLRRIGGDILEVVVDAAAAEGRILTSPAGTPVEEFMEEPEYIVPVTEEQQEYYDAYQNQFKNKRVQDYFYDFSKELFGADEEDKREFVDPMSDPVIKRGFDRLIAGDPILPMAYDPKRDMMLPVLPPKKETLGQATRREVGTVFDSALDLVDDSLKKTDTGAAISKGFKEFVDPADLTTSEQIASGIGEFVVPLVGASKVSKIKDIDSKAKKIAKLYAIGVGADVLQRDADEQYFVDLVGKLGPDAEDALARLELDPNDGAAERRLKQITDSFLFETAAMGLIKGITTTPKVAKLGAKGAANVARQSKDKLVEAIDASQKATPYLVEGMKAATKNVIGKARAVNQNKVLTPIEGTKNAVPVKVDVVKLPNNEYRQQGFIKEIIGRVNTGAGRLFSSQAAMPAPLFKADLRRRRSVESQANLVKYEVNRLDRQLKEAKKASKGLPKTGPQSLGERVNRVLLGDMTEYGVLRQSFPRLMDVADDARKAIDNQEQGIIDLLNLPKNSKIALSLDDKGIPYLTRAYEFTTNPAWSKDIMSVMDSKKLKKFGMLPKTEHNTEVIRIVENARNFIKLNNPKATIEEVDGILTNMIDSGKKSGSLNVIMDVLDSGGMGSYAVKTMKGRKKIEKPILEFLGEIKSPVRNVMETLNNQNKLLTELSYFKEVLDFAERNMGKTVKLPGLSPIGYTKTTTFFPTPRRGADIGDVRTRVSQLADERLGALGGRGEAVGLGELSTTADMFKLIDNGIDLYKPGQEFGLAGRIFRGLLTKPMAYMQAAETTFDHTAYGVNTYGMLQGLAMNGTLLRPSVLKNSIKSFKTMVTKATNGDKEALEYLARLKRDGVIDSSLTVEGIKRNLDTYGDEVQSMLGKAFKAPFKAPSFVYGGIDDFGKMISHQAEFQAYRKAFPNKTDDEIFEIASDVVRNTMPSYSTAAPIVRALSRMPIGTYATFPAEVLRTQKNILVRGFGDIAEGTATGNARLAATGMRRLSAWTGVTLGIEAYVNGNNSVMGVGVDALRGINQAAADWQKTTKKLITEAPTLDKDTGVLSYAFVDSGMMDAAQYVKGPVRAALMSRTLIGDTPTETEIKELFTNSVQETLAPFYSEKFIVPAIVKGYLGIDPETGKSILRGMSAAEDAELRIKGALGPLLPGSKKSFNNLRESFESELKRGEGKGQTVGGFPKRFSDQALHFFTGVRNNYVNANKTWAMDLSKDLQEFGRTKPAFDSYLKEFGDREMNQDDIQEVFYKAHEYYQVEKKRQARLKDRIEVYAQTPVKQWNKKNKEYELKPLGVGNVLNFLSSNGEYDVPDKVISTLVEKGAFTPTPLVARKNYKQWIVDRKYPVSLVEGLKQIEGMYAGQPLREEKE